MRARAVGLFLGALCVAGVAEADPALLVGPTVGVWQWDQEAVTDVDLQHRRGAVYGVRAGYEPMEAFAGELVLLTGANDAVADDGGMLVSSSVRKIAVELSLRVHFQTVVSGPVYPFLDLGAGTVFRRGGPTVAGTKPWPSTHLAFHLGGGIMADLSPRIALRFNVRDTFFGDTQKVGGQDNQVTVDSLELSGGLEYRIPLGRGRGPRRLE
jgi:opacity protein-like surface antigen